MDQTAFARSALNWFQSRWPATCAARYFSPALLAMSVLAGACGPVHAQPSDQEVEAVKKSLAPAEQSPADWQSHADPMGFTVRHPKGWQVATKTDKGYAEFRNGEGDSVLAWPVFSNLEFNFDSATSLTRQVAGQLWPQAQLQNAEMIGKSALRFWTAANNRVGVFAMTWANTPRGAAGFIYLTSASRDRYAAAVPTLAGIIESLRFGVESKPEGSAPALQFVRWADPREGAFDVEVPSGWKVAGGLFRYSAVDFREEVRAASPDGTVRLISGDQSIPFHAIPNALLQSAGFGEGSSYPVGYGQTLLVKRYPTGAEFLKDYVQRNYGRQGMDLQIAAANDVPDADREINAIYGRFAGAGINMKSRSGDISFTCRFDGKLMHGYLMAGTTSVMMPGNGIWYLSQLNGFLATEDQVPLALAANSQLIKSRCTDQAWAARQQATTMTTFQIVTAMNAYISRLISDTYWNRQRTLNRTHQAWSDATRGVVRVWDPVYKMERTVTSGSTYHWIDNYGRITGTNVHARPDNAYNYRELLTIPRN